MQSATTGLPEHMCAANMKKNYFVLTHMREILDALTRGLPLDILTKGYGVESRGVMLSYQAYSHDNSTPDFLIELAHKAIDNGADVFVGHGVHTLRGVEIYKGKPIFYGVASFIQHEEPAIEVTDPSRPPVAQQSRQPDNKEVLLTTSRYEGGKLVEARLYPVDCGIDGTRTVSKAGVPMTPSPEQAQRILKLVQDLSKPFGTEVVPVV